MRNLLILLLTFSLVSTFAPGIGFAQDDTPAKNEPAETEPTEAPPAESAKPNSEAEVSTTDEVQTASLPADPDEADSPKYTKWTALVASITIFVLAVFVGFEIITKVPPTLHTPLMSGSNAISGISIVGALLATALGANWFASVLGFLAIVLATVNVVGGYMVTNRMLSMFKAKR